MTGMKWKSHFFFCLTMLQIFTSYIDLLYPTEDRQDRLRDSYFFTCDCRECATKAKVMFFELHAVSLAVIYLATVQPLLWVPSYILHNSSEDEAVSTGAKFRCDPQKWIVLGQRLPEHNILNIPDLFFLCFCMQYSFSKVLQIPICFKT